MAESRTRQPGTVVYLCGLGTSALALWLVRILNDHGQNVMGLYANGILPVGAILVGIFSGLGYALASRLLQVKLGRAFLLGMISTALIDYGAAQYLTWTHILEQAQVSPDRYSFMDYMRDQTEHMVMSRSGSTSEGAELGWFGYFFKLLEIGGYVLGAVVPSMLVAGMPYCSACQQYLKQQRVGYVRSEADWAPIKKMPKAERTKALQDAINEVCARGQAVSAHLANATCAEVDDAIGELAQKQDSKAAASYAVTFKKCPGCDTHHLSFTLHNWTVNKKPNQSAITSMLKPAEPAPIQNTAS